jgi:FHS family L-fucose permease-like MFS transporter
MSTRSTPPAQSTPSYTGPFITVAVLFFIFGFITNLNMALVPHLRSIFDLPYAWAMLAESAFFLAYFVFSSPTSKLIETIGYKRTMVVSLFIQVVGCLLFVPSRQAGQLSAVPDCGIYRWRGRHGAADCGQSLRRDSRPRT